MPRIMLPVVILLLGQAALPAQTIPTEIGRREYQIGPDDILRVTVYGVDDLTQTVVVQADGTFTYPLIGRVKAADLTANELQEQIVTQLARGFVRNPQVTVVVHEYRSKTVYVVGEVTRPGPYPLSGNDTVVEMLAKAGPTAGAGAEVVIIRPKAGAKPPVLPAPMPGTAGAPGTQADVIRVNLRDIQAGRLDQNVRLMPNDTVFVSQAPRIYVTGEVRSPGAFFFAPGLSVRQAVSMAGGLSPDGSSGRLRVVRMVNGKSKALKIKLDDPILPGDTIVVKAKLF
jgi:polysaccharide export outer membrane protein